MAIVVGEKRTGIKFGTIVFGVAVLSLAIGSYYLFFAPVPFIETVTQPKNIQMISNFTDKDSKSGEELVREIQESPIFNSLRSYVEVSEPGTLGRVNPFAEF